MKSILPLLVSVVIFSSCTTAYKSGQTPDDVYYSPARPQDDYVRREIREREREYRWDEDAYRDDRFLRMKIRNRRYVDLYDDYYSYNPYNYHYVNSSLYYNSPWNSHSYWNNYYNPNCIRPVFTTPGNVRTVVNKPRTFDLNVYNSGTPGTVNPKGRTYGTYSSPGYNSGSAGNNSSRSGQESSSGGRLRDVFSGSGSSNSGSSSSPTSTKGSSSTPAPASSSGSSGSGSTNAPTRKF